MLDLNRVVIKKANKKDQLILAADIWLQASIIAHNFMPKEFWKSKLNDMQALYLPAALVYVASIDDEIIGFYALHEHELAAIFVAPKWQGKGVGSQLLKHAIMSFNTMKTGLNSTSLTLSVYKENPRSYAFYLKYGFREIREEIDPHTQHVAHVMIYQAD